MRYELRVLLHANRILPSLWSPSERNNQEYEKFNSQSHVLLVTNRSLFCREDVRGGVRHRPLTDLPLAARGMAPPGGRSDVGVFACVSGFITGRLLLPLRDRSEGHAIIPSLWPLFQADQIGK